MIRKKIEQLKKALSDPAPASPLDELTEGSDHDENDHDTDHGDLDASFLNSLVGKSEVNTHSETTTERTKDQSSGETDTELLPENSVEQLEAKDQIKAEQIKERSEAEQLEDNRHNTDDETNEIEQFQHERHETEPLKEEGHEAEQLTEEGYEAGHLTEEGYEAEQLKDGVQVEGGNVRENAQLTEEGHEAEQLEDEVHDTEQLTEEENQADQLDDGAHNAEHLEDEVRDAEQVNDAGHEAEQLQLEETQHLKDENIEMEQTEVEGHEVEQLKYEGHDIDQPKDEVHEPEQTEVEEHEAEQLEEDRYEADKLEGDRQDAEQTEDDVQEAEHSADEEHEAEQSADEEHETEQEARELIELLKDEAQQAGQLVDEGLEAEQLEEDSYQTAAVSIQCAFRVHRDRKKVAQLRKNNELEQLKNAEAEQARIDREGAAVKIQSCLRMHRGQQQVEELRAIYEAEKSKAERDAAAVKIQSAFRVNKLMRTASQWQAQTEEPDVVQQVVRQLFLEPDPATASTDTDLNSQDTAGDVDDTEEETQISPKFRYWLKRRQKRQRENSSLSSGQKSSVDGHAHGFDVATGTTSSPTDDQTKSGHKSDSPQMMQRKIHLKEREQADHVSSAPTQEQTSSSTCSEAGDNRIVAETEPKSPKPVVPLLNLAGVPACATDSNHPLDVDTGLCVDTGSESDTLTSEDLANATAAAMAAMTAHVSPKGAIPHDAQPSQSTPDLEAASVLADVPVEYSEYSAAARLQSLVRCRLARRDFVQKRKAASWLQCVVRGWWAWRVRRAAMSGRYTYNPLDCTVRRVEHAGRTPRSARRSRIVRAALSPSSEKTPRNEKRKFPILASVHTKYEVVKKVIAKNGFITTKQKTLWGFQWTDVEKWIHTGLKGYQCRNVVPGVSQITNKCNLSRKMNVMQKFAAEHFTFYPKSWCLPKDRYRLEAELRRRNNHGATFIAKPDTTCQGKGITLMQGNPKGMITNVDWKVMPCVVQKYISNPLLIQGFKFDMRIYVLLIAPTATSRKKIFLHKDGLVRMCTQAYEPPNASNLDNVKMHLSNYAINKEKPPPAQRKPPITPSTRVRRSNTIPRRGGYTPSSRQRASARLERRRKLAQAHRKAAAAATSKKKPPFVKTSVRWLGQWLEKTRGRGTMMRMWCGIADCVTKTILSSTHVFAAYRKRSCAPDTKCFHILGFDIMLDSDLQPHLLEVNTSPSFNGDAGVDTRVKTAVLMQAFKLAKVLTRDVALLSISISVQICFL